MGPGLGVTSGMINDVGLGVGLCVGGVVLRVRFVGGGVG